MRTPRLVLIALFVLLFANLLYSQRATAHKALQPAASFGDTPLAFESNQGQASPEVQFLSHGTGSIVELSGSRAIFTLAQKEQETHSVTFQWLGANAIPKATGEKELSGRTNYLVGNHQQWIRGIKNYGRVRYESIYPGVDLVYYGNHRKLEYDFELAPQADASKIKLSVQDADQLTLQSDGSLLVHTQAGDLSWQKPIAYQIKDGKRNEVEVAYSLEKENDSLAFQLGAYDHSIRLTIDPTLAYAALIGPTEFPQFVAADSSGSAYTLSSTISSEYPTTAGSYMPTGQFTWQPPSLYGGPGHSLLAISKFSPDGSALIYSTYLGGSEFVCSDGNASPPSGNVPGAITIDASGQAIIAGNTDDTNFPVTANAIQSTEKNCGGGAIDVTVSKLSADGSTLLYSTYLGSSGNDFASSIAVDSSNNIFVGGLAQQTDFPTTTNLSSCTGYCSDAFVTKIKSDGSLGYSLLFGGANSGPQWPNLNVVAVDTSGNAYVAGTSALPLPVVNAIQPTLKGSQNAFVGEVKPDGTGFAFLTYLGGSLGAVAYGIAVDASGNIYVDGTTWDNDFPTKNAYQATNKNPSHDSYRGSNGFLTKYSPGGQSYVYSTYLGGTKNTGEVGIAVGPNGEPFLAGTTSASDYPVTPDAYLVGNPPNHLLSTFTVFRPNGRALLYSTYFGGASVNGASAQAESIAITPDGKSAFLAGTNFNSVNVEDFPVTPGAYDNPHNGDPSNNRSHNQVSATFVASFCVSCDSVANLTIISPQNGAVLTNPVDFIAKAYDPDGVSALQIYAVPGTVAYQTTSSNLNKKLNLAPGSYDVVVQEWSDSGTFLKKTVNIQVQNGPPTVTITSPAPGATVSNPVHVVATARVNGSGKIAHYRIYSASGVDVYDVDAATLNTSVDLPQGAVNLTVVAWDSSGAAGAASAKITVSGGSDAGGAQVVITSPVSYRTVSSPVTFAATATTSCKAGIYALQVYTNPGVVAYTAYASSVNTTVTLSPGYYYGAVQAWDNCGATFSSPVQFQVQ